MAVVSMIADVLVICLCCFLFLLFGAMLVYFCIVESRKTREEEVEAETEEKAVENTEFSNPTSDGE